ncbi:MAG: GYD domain-containing protein [Xanthobacteraceae bacterium]|nr:GYD domain-containing protein [Xanthobacteraceae bacterium]
MRIGKAKAKLDELGIKIESIHYSQGTYDFVDVVDAPNPEAMLAFSVWYATHGSGADPKHAGVRREELRSSDQGRRGLNVSATGVACYSPKASAASVRNSSSRAW